jgi:hypothetical protein
MYTSNMQLSSCQALLALGLLSSSIVSGYQQVTFQPATGFYVCPGVGSVCNVKGCHDETTGEDICSTIANGFNSSLVDGIMVYTSHTQGADLVIVGVEESAIKCHADCKCQSVTKTIPGCSLPSTQDEFLNTDMVKVVTDEASSDVSQANTESAAQRTLRVGGLLVSAMAMIFASTLISI